MTLFLRQLTALLLHKAGNALIAAALCSQRLGFICEFGSDWRARRDLHYRNGIARENWRLNT